MSGLDLAKRVGLKLGECETFSERVECSSAELEETLRKKFSQGIFVAWQIQRIVWGTFDGKKLLLKENSSPNFDDWLECRIFNANEEIHLRRFGDKFIGRYVHDDLNGAGNFYVDSFARLWGEEISSENGWTKLEDASRKISMTIPAIGGEKLYGLTTRNYIADDDETGLSGYVDYRFVATESAWDGD